ncbi:hypothetical protein [Nocardia alni]|uniref:hypothetical protein n=1 Tax=Nocardia alni TaxID=2815723 RepID=UPI001C2205E1|nr:hypothetical protein [Nocardia alni]
MSSVAAVQYECRGRGRSHALAPGHPAALWSSVAEATSYRVRGVSLRYRAYSVKTNGLGLASLR